MCTHPQAVSAETWKVCRSERSRNGESGTVACPSRGWHRPLAGVVGLRVYPDSWRMATGQARWGTGVWMSACRGGVVLLGRVMKVAASAAALMKAAAQIQLMWPKLEWNRTGSL
jgi:hypothetical protein